MKPIDCTLYNKCECPLCPLENNPLEIWYSEDNICKNPQFPTITNSMRKLKKKQAEGFFTLRMLNRNFIVRRGIKGLNPDVSETVRDPLREYKIQEERWLKKHPEIPEQKIESMRERGRKSLGFIQKPLSRPSIFESDYPGYDNTHLDVDTSKKSSENGGIEK
ncbi:MAG: hypothetical protein QXV17_14070 [Candidatus Micrarchaeaceae archaeon]